MLIIASDIHMTDRTAGAPVKDAELTQWLEDLDSRRKHSTGTLEIVFLGDIVDIIRSRVWDEGPDTGGARWKEAEWAYPWNAVGREFRNLATSRQNAIAGTATSQILACYPRFFEKLAQLRTDGVRVHYVPGNHDALARWCPAVQEALKSRFGVESFPDHYENDHYDVFAEHGDRFDPYNWHQQAEGIWAVGDAVVILLINRLAGAVQNALRASDAHSLVHALAELDNVEFDYLVPEYIARALQNELDYNDAEHVLAKKAVQGVITQFVNEVNRSFAAHHHLPALLEPFNLLLDWKLTAVPAAVGKVRQFFLPSDNLRSQAQMRRDKTLRRTIVFGHTHNPCMEALRAPAKEGAFRYVNTGTWRQIQAQVPGSAGQFLPYRTRSWVEITRNDIRQFPRVRHVHEREA